MTVEEKIQRALFDRVRTLVTSPSLPIAWENDHFTAPPPYLRVQQIPNRNTRFLLKGSDPHFRQGILQLTVAARLNAGPDAATALAGAVAAHFSADLALYSEGLKVTVQAAPDAAPAMKSGTTWDVPVSIRYQTFA